MTVEKDNFLAKFQKWLADEGLYSPISLDGKAAISIAKAIDHGGLSVDCYCPYCQDASVFRFISGHKMVPPAMIPSRTGNYYDRVNLFLNQVLTDMKFHCARERAHNLRFFLKVSKDSAQTYKIKKIGQYPSKLDLLSGEIRNYRKHAPTDAGELHIAAICASAGFHVAAFVYLRRVFERRIEIAHKAAKNDDGWDETAYDPRTMRMEERIDALRDHLPDFLVENRKIYSILSKGMHELTEEDCAEAFSSIELGIKLILDEEIAMKRKAAKVARVSGDLAKLQAKHNA